MKNVHNMLPKPKGHTTAWMLVASYGISLNKIARLCRTDFAVVKRALVLESFETVGYGKMVRIRAVIASLLAQAGWDGDPADLWAEYDERIELAAA